MRRDINSNSYLFPETLIRANHMKRSKSLPAMKRFFAKNDFNAGNLPALKSFFVKNDFNAGKDFERFMRFARMRVSGNSEGRKVASNDPNPYRY